MEIDVKLEYVIYLYLPENILGTYIIMFIMKTYQMRYNFFIVLYKYFESYSYP